MAVDVFISHASGDRWVAGQFSKELEAVGAECFLDSSAVETGDVIDDRLWSALAETSELLVLFTPAALTRPYVWVEIGSAWGQKKRIAGVPYGVTTDDLVRQGAPAFMRGILFRDINEFDEYVQEFRQRRGDD